MATYAPAALAVQLPGEVAAGLGEAMRHLPEIRLVTWNSNGRSLYVTTNPCDAMIEAIRLAEELGLPCHFIDELPGRGEAFKPLPDPLVLERIGAEEFARLYNHVAPGAPAGDRALRIAGTLRAVIDPGVRTLAVVDIRDWPELEKALLVEDLPVTVPPVSVPHRNHRLAAVSLGQVIQDIPMVAWLFENFRAGASLEEPFPHLRAIQTILAQASERYTQEYDERLNMTEWGNLLQYARNLGVVRGWLRPTLWELIESARGCIDDDYAAILLETAEHYPPNDRHPPPLPTQSDEPAPGSEPAGRALEAESAYPEPPMREMELNFVRRRPTWFEKESWRLQLMMGQWSGSGICSWPPEDEFIEKFFRDIRKRAWQQVSEQHSHSEEFSTSLLDGLDIRETLRHLHEEKIYVRRERVPPGRVGPVVLLWRDLPLGLPRVWRTTLYAENQNESDLAIYARPLGREIVGPGITRTEYYGVLSIYPARHIRDPWLAPTLQRWKTHGRLMIAAAILLAQERYVAVVAKRPPDRELRDFARQHGRILIYMPLTAFSRNLLKRARQCHILMGHQVRGWASEYIPPI